MTQEIEHGTGIGTRLRAARERLGWSREALAFHSGISWSAIAQVEAGRRTNVRPGTLAALSRPLGVTIDYLVSGGPPPAPMLQHSAFLYRTDEQYQTTMGAFLLEGIERGEATLALTTKKNIKLLREWLGDEAQKAEFVESREWLTTPGDALDEFRSFCRTKLSSGSAWVRFITEPIWEGRTDEEVRLWTQFESMFDLLFGNTPATVACPYDERVVKPEILSNAQLTHALIVSDNGLTESARYRGPGRLALDP
jgi:transcriptional regulator with XRE-family HTH domain